MTNGMIDQKQFDFYGYKTVEVSDGSVQVINPQGLLIARAPSFKEATRIIAADRRAERWVNLASVLDEEDDNGKNDA